jgi:hypothetical protein
MTEPRPGPAKTTQQVMLETLQKMQDQMNTMVADSASLNCKMDVIEERVNDGIEAQETLALATKAVPKMKRQGNQKQVGFAFAVKDKNDAAIAACRSGKPMTAVDLLLEGNETIAKRVKLISYADSTSWAAATEYEGPELAEDSADEKKMRRCEAAAEKKSKSGGKSRGARTNRSYKFFNKGRESFRDGRSYDREDRDSNRNGKCFECGKYGHWARECRDKKKSSNGNNYKSKRD